MLGVRLLGATTETDLSPADWMLRADTARAMASAGRLREATAALVPALGSDTAPLDVVRMLGQLAQASGDLELGRRVAETLVRRQPNSAVAEHNLAARSGDLGRLSDSEAAARRALAKGGDAPETWLVLARALQGQGRLDEAEAAFGEAIRRRPDNLVALRDLAQLVWMRAGDVDRLTQALAPLRTLAARDPGAAAAFGAILRQTAGDRAGYEALESWAGPADARIEMSAGEAAAGFDLALARSRYGRAVELAPTQLAARQGLWGAWIATGEAERAERELQAHLTRQSADPFSLALLDMARRELGRPQALGAADYQALVRVYDLAEGMDEGARDRWLSEVGVALRRLHPFETHPFDQSAKHAAQSAVDPRAVGDPAVDRLFERIEAAVGDYVEIMAPSGAAPAWRISGAWSIRMRAGGRHLDHVHPRGWISSAAYLDLPRAAEGADRQGWIRFGAGRFGMFSQPALHWVRPEIGKLVLFPSHLWHGTEPFEGEGERLTVAFDVERVPNA